MAEQEKSDAARAHRLLRLTELRFTSLVSSFAELAYLPMAAAAQHCALESAHPFPAVKWYGGVLIWLGAARCLASQGHVALHTMRQHAGKYTPASR